MKEAGEKFDLKIISEVVDTRDVDLVAEYVDIIQMVPEICRILLC
jgi:3-deoxy-D-arabino-heptulosonate 7-phosphate (DAHP) synthase